ncbi:MAG TPA: alkaline phosphatase family protein [Solirubrobacteraceae bacterium]|nr:alkaline phosphatase family protein [Solirubrobacteraceae bacterium]
MRRATRIGTAAAVIAAAAIGGSAAAVSAHQPQSDHYQHGNQIKHVLLISVDGMHQSDLDWYVANHPNSELARLATGGAEYTDAHTADPSDSDPAGTAIMTGGDPKVTGIYYDDEYSHGVFPPGTTNCSGPVPGGDVIYDSPDDKLANVPDLLTGSTTNTFPSFDEGGSIYSGNGGASGAFPGDDTNPALIMNLSDHPQSGLNPATYPVDPKTCQPIQPWDFVGVNTIFQVIHAAGMRTAYSEKHAIYSSFNGPGSNGTSIDDFFAPEIDSQAVEPNGVPYPVDDAWTADNAATKQYDSYKVQAVINWINGYDHSGKGPKVGTPAIYGMNFQTVSTAEKLKSSPAVLVGPNAQGDYTEGPKLPGGYTTVNGQQVPGPLLQSALDYVNDSLQEMADTIQADGEADSTAIILTAKHGQSPLNNNQLQRIDDGPIISGVNAAWAALHPSTPTLVVQEADDDGLLWWLSDRSQAATDFVKNYLWTHTAPAVNYAGQTITVQHSGLTRIFAGEQSAAFFGVPNSDPHHPDVFGISQVGTIYTTGSKIAEHGGDNPGDRDVPLVVYAPGVVRPGSSGQWVETTQVAPTILRLLGLNPYALQAVQREGTQVLPGIDQHRGG